MKFSDNFNIFSITSMILFYFNKEFHLRMSFDSDTTDYETTRERLEVRKADDIVMWMKELLNFDHQQLKKTKLIIEVQVNKHRRDVIYEVNDWVWLSSRNVKTTRLCKDLKDKQLDLYQITVKVSIFYHLRLSVSMKHEASAFDFQLEATAIVFRRFSIRTAFTITQINHYRRRWTLRDRRYIELQTLSRSNTVQSQMNRSR